MSLASFAIWVLAGLLIGWLAGSVMRRGGAVMLIVAQHKMWPTISARRVG
jgi:hypothetical protein